MNLKFHLAPLLSALELSVDTLISNKKPLTHLSDYVFEFVDDDDAAGDTGNFAYY